MARAQPTRRPKSTPEQIDRTVQAVLGNGRRGLAARVDDMEDAFFRNEATGDPGVIARLKRIETRLTLWAGVGSAIVFILGLAAGWLGHVIG